MAVFVIACSLYSGWMNFWDERGMGYSNFYSAIHKNVIVMKKQSVK